MEKVSLLSNKKLLDLIFFVSSIIYILTLDRYIINLLEYFFSGKNINLIDFLFFTLFSLFSYISIKYWAKITNISNQMVNILLLFITVLSIIKIIFSSDSIEILIDVIILDFGAIYVIYEIVKRYHVKPDRWLGINKFKIENLRYAGFYFIAWPVIIIWSQIIEFFDLDFFKSTNYSEEIFSSLNNNYLVIFIMACIVAPICEEIIFRGYFFRVLKERFNLLFAIITNSIFFGLIHFEPSAIVPATILGVSLTLIRLKAKSLLLPITIHALHNLLAFIVTYLTL